MLSARANGNFLGEKNFGFGDRDVVGELKVGGKKRGVNSLNQEILGDK